MDPTVGDDSSQATALDHTEQYKQSLLRINAEVRAASIAHQSSVKEMFGTLHKEGNDLSEWWTTLVRDLDLVEDIARRPGQGWVDVVDAVVKEELSQEQAGMGDGSVNAVQARIYAEMNTNKWEKRFRPVLQQAENLEKLLPWKLESKSLDKYSVEGLRWLSKQANFKDDFGECLTSCQPQNILSWFSHLNYISLDFI